MGFKKYKGQNKKNYKKRVIVLFVLIFILFLGLIFLNNIEEKEEEPIIEYDKISTVRDIIEYHKSRYISENESEEKGFYLDIYVEFGLLLYENEKSNEEYYNKLLEDVAKVINYYSFKLIDKKNEITIKVICDRTKIKSIIINDIEDYFILTDSQISLNKYKEIPVNNFSIQSELLLRCIENNWADDFYIGSKESIFDGYEIYFDEGIKVRVIDGKIYNIIFTKNYAGNIIEDISTSTKKEYITTRLGKPAFQSEDEQVIGYKGKDIYVFFTDNEVSVYRNNTIDSDEFFELADEYINGNMDLLDFMNELTYLWPDYSEYYYNETSVFISYPLKGIEIRINYGDINGILVYNNNKSTMSKISRYLENTIFVGRLQNDLVFEAEKTRFQEANNQLNRCKEFEEKLTDLDKNKIGNSMKYEIYPEYDSEGYIYSMKFISSFGNEPNRELNDGIYSYFWANNDCFIFSKSGIGIYMFDLNTGLVRKIYSSKEVFEFKEYNRDTGLLIYDDGKEVILQF